MSNHDLSRRRFLHHSALSAAALAALSSPALAQEKAKSPKAKSAPTPSIPNKFCLFVKPLQSLSYDELADRVAEMGFHGIESTVRANGHVLPERVEDDLPKLVDALKKRNLEISVMTTDIKEINPLNEKVLRTAAGLGVKLYRMAPHFYDHARPVIDQLHAVKPIFLELASLNRQLKLQGSYQNHSGARYIGAPIWDIYQILKDIPLQQLGLAFDIGHATVEGGFSWPTHYNLIRPHIAAAYFKDFRWTGDENPRRRFGVVPMGTGYVEPRYMPMLLADGFTGPISLHVEYTLKDPVEVSLEAIRRDFATIKSWIKS